MKLRIKMKTMLIVMAVLILGGGLGYRILPDLLYAQQKYDMLLRWFPDHRQAESALNLLLNDTLEKNGGEQDNRFYIYPGGGYSYSGNPSDYKDQTKIRQWLEEMIEKYKDRSNSRMKHTLAKIYFNQKEWELAEKWFREAIEASADSSPSFVYDEAKDYLTLLQTRQNQPDVTPDIMGRVMIGDRPASGVLVFLERNDQIGRQVPPDRKGPMTITDDDGQYRFYNVAAHTYTAGVGISIDDVEGYFLKENNEKQIKVEEGKTAAFDFHFVPQVQIISPSNKERLGGDELVFEWEPYEGAAYYTVQAGSIIKNRDGKVVGSGSSPLSDVKYDGTTARYELNDNRWNLNGFSKSYSGKEAVSLNPSELLGEVYPGGQFIWFVQAFDQQGNILSDSRGYPIINDTAVPMFQLADDGMLYGDRLILQTKYEEAIASYIEEGENDNALRTLARLAYIGISTENGDLAEALQYVERIKQPNVGDKQLKEIIQKELSKQSSH